MTLQKQTNRRANIDEQNPFAVTDFPVWITIVSVGVSIRRYFSELLTSMRDNRLTRTRFKSYLLAILHFKEELANTK